jgi:hypothetical protein
MNWRVLTREEARTVPGMIDPVPDSLVAVGAVDDAGQVVACIGTFAVLHADPVWVREDHRTGKTLLRLWETAKQELAQRGVGGVEVLMTPNVPGQPLEDTVARLCEAAGGVEVKLRHFVVPIEVA